MWIWDTHWYCRCRHVAKSNRRLMTMLLLTLTLLVVVVVVVVIVVVSEAVLLLQVLPIMMAILKGAN